MPESCEWHFHSMFHPCPNGLYRRDYLFEPLPRTAQDVLAGVEIRSATPASPTREEASDA